MLNPGFNSETHHLRRPSLLLIIRFASQREKFRSRDGLQHRSDLSIFAAAMQACLVNILPQGDAVVAARKVDMLKSVKWPWFLCAAVAVCFASVMPVLGATQGPPATVAAKTPSAVSVGAEARLVVWNRTIVVFRSPLEQLSPAQRAAGAKARVEALPEFGPWSIVDKPVTLGAVSGILISVNQQPVFGVLPGDVNPEIGETVGQAASQAVL